MCGNKLARADLWANVGTDFTNECTLDVLDLMRTAQQGANETLLFDLYYVDGLEDASMADIEAMSLQQQQFDGRPVLYPVPLIIENIQRSGRQEEAQLTRRFFMIDTQLGRAAEEETPAWVQYASSVRLVIQVGSVQMPASVCLKQLALFAAPCEPCTPQHMKSGRGCPRFVMGW